MNANRMQGPWNSLFGLEFYFVDVNKILLQFQEDYPICDFVC